MNRRQSAPTPSSHTDRKKKNGKTNNAHFSPIVIVIHTHTPIHIYMHAYVYIHTHTHTHTHTHAYILYCIVFIKHSSDPYKTWI